MTAPRNAVAVRILAMLAMSACLPAVADQHLPSAGWEQRNSPQAVEAAAKQFLDMLVLDEGEMKANRLWYRPELVAVSRLAGEKKYPEAVAAFERYFLNKLDDPSLWAPRYPDNPYIGPYKVDLYFQATDAPALLDRDHAAIMAEADGLLRHELPVDGRSVDIGAPGTVNWNFPIAADRAVLPHERVNPTLANPIKGLRSLVQAYVLTHDRAYLETWAEYLNDWAINARYLDETHPCFSNSGLNGIDSAPITLVRDLRGLAAALPADQLPLPPPVLARVLRKALSQQLLSIVYRRSNCHNWTPTMVVLANSLLFDEFKLAPLLFREARRRNIEDNAVTQNLRDGTENQQCPWYNRNYLTVYQAFLMLQARPQGLWMELPWVAEIRRDLDWKREVQGHLDQRANWLLRGRTPQNEWPAAFRGGQRIHASGITADGIEQWAYSAAPEAFNDPENARLVAAITTPEAGLRPSYTDEWFPYGGYNIVREGWEKDSGYGAMFCSPKPGAYGGGRSRSNNNTFALAAFGHDLLVEDNPGGHYVHANSPVTVDGLQQYFHAGIYRVFNPAGHKGYQVSAWTDPAPWRWHSSPRFSLMEGVYAGPWADLVHREPLGRFSAADVKWHGVSMPLDQTLQGVTHQRLVHFLRRHNLWLVTDRLISEKPHRYEQYWCFPRLPGEHPAFTPDQVKVDAEARRIYTDAGVNEFKTRQGVNKREPMANVSLYQFTTATTSYSSAEWPAPSVAAVGLKKIKTAWDGEGAQQMITAILPRKPGSGPERDMQATRQLTGPDGVTGCELNLPDGGVVRYLAAPNSEGTLTIDDLTMRGESLLLDGEGGVALGCKHLSVKGKAIEVPASDFEFTLRDGELSDVTPIDRPIDPVQILPERNVFVDQVEVTLASRTPGVAIHYTLDSTDPTPQSPLYTGPFMLTRSTTLKARAFRPGVTASPVQLSGVKATVASMAVFTKAAPMPAMTVSNVTQGLEYQYFEDDWKKLWLFLNEVQPKATGTVGKLFDPSIVPVDNPPVGEAATPRTKFYAVQYTGFLKVPVAGVYTIHAPREYVMPDTDAGYELQVHLGNQTDKSGSRVIGLNQWYPATRLHAFGTWSVALEAGLHPFKVFFLDYRTDAAKHWNFPGLRDYIWSGVAPDLRISGPGIDTQPVPADWLLRKH